MPEITTLPNLSPAPAPASTARAASGTAAPANIPNVPNAANAKHATNTPAQQATGSAADDGTAPDSFASVLRRQLAQSAMDDQPKPGVEPALQPRPGAALGVELALQPRLGTDLGDDLGVPLALQPRLEAALGADLARQSKLAAAQEAGLSTKPEALAAQETPDDGFSLLSPYLFQITPNAPVKLDANLPATDKKPVAAPAGDALLNLAAAALVQTHLSAAKDAPQQAAIAEVSTETASKTAEFAALLASSADAVATQASHSESAAGNGSGFDNALAAAQMASQTRSGAAHSSAPTAPALSVQTPVGAHGWDGEVSDKLVWMVGRQEQRAELVLNPPQLGRVEVSLSMHGDQTSAIFVSANPAVRDALEAALPRLREILADAGINLGQAQVGADTSNNAANQSTNPRENGDNSGRGSNKDSLTPGGDALRPLGSPQWLKRADSMVDVFA